MCFPENDVNINLLNKALPPKLTYLISSLSAYLLLLAVCNTSKIRSRWLYGMELTELLSVY